MKKLIYVFLILMLSVNYLYAQGVDSKEKKPSKNSEAYLISETTKVIDEYLSIDSKFKPNSDCDSSRFKECYYCLGGGAYYTKFVYNSKTFQDVYVEIGKNFEGENIGKLPEKTTLKNINNTPVLFLYKDNILAISYIIDGEVDSANTIILRKRSDGLIEAMVLEVVG